MKKDVSKWKQLRARGMKYFILKHGVLGWGLSTGILFSIVQYFISDGGWSEFRRIFTLAMTFFPLFGIGWGYVVWKAIECAAAKKGTDLD